MKNGSCKTWLKTCVTCDMVKFSLSILPSLSMKMSSGRLRLASDFIAPALFWSACQKNASCV